MITIKRFVFNPFQENTYLLFDETKECIIIDPGCIDTYERDILKKEIEKELLKPLLLLNTHCHLDHVFGCKFVVNEYNVPFAAHPDDEFFIGITKDHAKNFGIEIEDNPPEISRYVNEGEIVRFGQSNLKVIHVPGHSPGGVVFFNEQQGFIIAGDVLFQGSVGRSDLPKGDHQLLIEGIRRKLLILNEDVIVYPGHGESTTIGSEKIHNPFLI